MLQKQRELGGNKWSKIAKDWQEMRGGQLTRNELQIKNRFKCLIKKEEASMGGDRKFGKAQIVDIIITKLENQLQILSQAQTSSGIDGLRQK